MNKITITYFLKLSLLSFFTFLFQNNILANDPCSAFFYDFGKGLRDTVPCGNAANTTSNIDVDMAGSTTFNLSGDCGTLMSAPNDYVAWFTFIIQGGGSSFEWQLIETGTDDVRYELYYSNDPMGPNECTDLSFYMCGNGFNSWELLGVPNPNIPTRFYVAIFTAKEDNDVDVVLKFRKACGETCLKSDISVVASPDVTIGPGESTQLSASPSGGGGSNYTFLWSPNDGSIDDITSQTPTVSPTTTTTYTVAVTGEDGCPAFDTVTVKVVTLEECLQKLGLVCPADFTGCPNTSTNPSVTGEPTVTLNDDKCPAYTVKYEDEVLQSDACGNLVINRKWLAYFDANPSLVKHCFQKITLIDNDKPVLSGIPSDATVECDNIPAAAASVSASDNCDNQVEITFSESVTNGACDANYTLTRTWTATDDCGNTSSKSQIIKVEDTTPPVLSGIPSDATVECDNIPAAAASVSASDNCDNQVEITFSESVTNGACDANYTLTRTWTATDDCGNTSSKSQIIKVEDTTPPVLSGIPSDATVECDNIPAPATSVSASDNCDNQVEVTFSESVTNGACDANYTLTRTWTAIDDCGNISSKSQIIKVKDTTPPVLSGIPSDATVECDNIPAPATSVSASDNCDNQVEVTFSESVTNGACDANYTLTRTWTAIDDCGNISSKSQIIKVEDTTPPVLSGIPSDATVECDNIPAASVSVSDNCDNQVEITFSESVTNSACDANYTLTRTWTAIDDCGNTSSKSQIIKVEDTTPPVLSGIPSDATVECDNIPAPATSVSASDNCDNQVEVTFSESVTNGACDANYTLTRTWTAIDDCGNISSKSQIIKVEDTTPPVLSGVPSDATVECDNIPAPATSVSASDNCDNQVEVTLQETQVNGACDANYTLTRTWTAIDDCGNIATAIQRVFVEDTTPPSIECPADITVSCKDIPEVEAPTVSDNCSSNDKITIELMEEAASACTEENGYYIITRKWKATDECGNEATCEQKITVETEIKEGCYGAMLDIIYDPVADTTTYIWMVHGEACAHAISYILFETPEGITALRPADGATYISAETGISYHVENTGYNIGKTLQGIKFETNGEGIKNEKEIFIYTLPGAPMDNVNIEIKAGRDITTFEIHTQNCECLIIPKERPVVEKECPDDIIVDCGDDGTTKVTWEPPTGEQFCSKCDENNIEIPGFMYMGTRGGHRYYCSKEKDIWHSAQATAESYGGHLAVINDPAENAFLTNFLVNQYAHIGLTDEGDEGNFRWVNNEPLTFTNWYKDQPNNYNNAQHYGQLLTSGEWNDNYADDSLEYIMEIPCVEVLQIAGPLNGSKFSAGTSTIVYLVEDDCGNNDICEFEVTVNPCEEAIEYCEAQGDNTYYFWINKFVSGSIDNASGSNGGYADFTYLSTDFKPGDRTMYLEPGYRSYRYPVYWKVWIDYNQDGDFEDTNEEVFDFRQTEGIGVKVHFSVPSSYVPGKTRLRVAMKYSCSPQSCLPFVYGEVEDYTVNLLPVASYQSTTTNRNNGDVHIEVVPLKKQPTASNNPALVVYPNPVANLLNVRIAAPTHPKGLLSIYNSLGQLVYEEKLNSDNQLFAIDVQHFKSGLYFLSVKYGDEAPLVQKFHKAER